jgi:hypothetical protein
VVKPIVKVPFGRPRKRWDLREEGFWDVRWVDLAGFGKEILKLRVLLPQCSLFSLCACDKWT